METLRLYPLGHLERLCGKRYTFKGTNVTIEPGTLVQMPTANMMRDPEYFPDPETFDPTRWSKEESANRNPYLQFAFGNDH